MNTHFRLNVAIVLLCLCFGTVAAGSDAPTPVLWSIGEADNNTKELLHGPGGYSAYRVDGLYCVGLSDSKTDWPYVHPGPGDGWAGSRPHTFTVVFYLTALAPEGTCRLTLDLADVHGSNPPMLKIDVNGNLYDRRTEKGSGSDDSVFGAPSRGKEDFVKLSFPVSTLRLGENSISITTTTGSWILYDYVSFEAPEGTSLSTDPPATFHISEPVAKPLLKEQDGKLWQVVRIPVRYFGKPCNGTVIIGDGAEQSVELSKSVQAVEVLAPAVEQDTEVQVTLQAGDLSAQATALLRPVRQFTVYLMPHTHLDIGYTHLQSDVEAMQWQHIDTALGLIEKTKDYPDGSRFKWLPEGLWAVDSYLRRATPEKREAFLNAVNAGSIGLDALYGNQLTALCRPEELVELTGYARRLTRETGVTIDTAMISDVPGYTWGLIPVLAQSGVKYMSIGPNAGHRIGFTLKAWGDKPFYWVSPSGQEEVLCWMVGKAYSWFHSGKMTDGWRIVDYLSELEANDFPYDIVHVRYNIGGDNGPPDPDLPDVVRAWNDEYAWPKLVLATPREAFETFEQRYGEQVPRVTGDFTPYWEDGAASSALETALNREAAERIVQAQTLWSMLRPDAYPAADFQAAWREVILYDEHTWGAHNSISEPESDFALGQWAIKQAFALEADKQSRALLDRATAPVRTDTANADTVAVFNTTAWARTGLVVLDASWAARGTKVSGADGAAVPSQVLSTGELAFIAAAIPPLSGARYAIAQGKAAPPANAVRVEGNRLDNGLVSVEIDPATGAISSLQAANLETNIAGSPGLNDYLYVAGRKPDAPQRNGVPRISVKESGPLVASLLIESDAPGCNALIREVRLVAGLDHVEIVDTLDKENVYEKEAVHIAFPFNVPDGVVRMDIPFAVARPEEDQMAGACKNYFTVQRWVDVSNEDFGVTWATIDTPLVQVGGITNDPTVYGWIETLEPSTALVAYVMNNYWETNYKASQDGVTVFRYALRPHQEGYDAVASQRFGVDQSQPLIAVATSTASDLPAPDITLTPETVIVVGVKPSDDGTADIVRLFNTAAQSCEAQLSCANPQPVRIEVSGLSELPGSKLDGALHFEPYEVKTLRVVY
jgi:alpha-mannosidase